MNEPPPADAILDLNGGVIPHGTPQTYTVDFTAGLSNTAITFAFREDPAFVSVFNTSVVNLTTSSGNLLTNGAFSGGTYTDNGNSATPTGWTYANIYGAEAGGVVTSSCEGYGSYCWYDGAVQAYDAISQTIATTVGDRYQVSFSATDNSDLTNWSRVSTNGDVTDTGGNGADILVYALAGLPPAGCAGTPGVNIKASAGETCFASGSYVSTNVIAGQATGAGAVLTNVNEGPSSVFFSTSAANTPAIQADAGGSVILAATPLSTSATVTTTGDNSIGLYATGSASTDSGVPSSITAQNVNVATQGSSANGVQADTGGAVMLNGGSVTVTGTGSLGLFATGTGSQINATDVAVSTAGDSSNGVVTTNGGTTTLNGGSINTTGNAAYAVSTNSGGLVSLSGTTIGTTGNGSGGLGINGGEIDATNVTITTTGAYDFVSGQHSYGVYNGPFESFTSGGVAKLTDVSISTQGVEMHGVLTDTGGATTILGGSIATSGAGAHAILSENGGTTIVNISASGPATLSTTGTSAPDGSSAAAVVAYNGGTVQLTGATVTTSGAGSIGLVVLGGTSSLSVNGISVATSGGIDSATGDHADGAFNGPYLPGGLISGGLMSLNNSTIATSGSGADGVVTDVGGTTTLTETKVSTSGVGAVGIESTAGGVTNISGGSVNTAGQDAHALFVTGSGSQANLSGAGTFTTTGAGAIGLYAALGGAISATGSTMTTIATSGGVSPATGLGAYGVNADGAGAQIKLGSATITTSGAGAAGLYASDRTASGAAGTITATGTLNVQTTNAATAAVALQGNGATIAATGGGTITAAGTAIAFMGGTGQSATFDNFAIGNLSGDLVFADPSIATVNFNNTIANAGTNNLLNATNGSIVTFNANASTLTGAIQTNSTSTTNVDLTNRTTWTMTGSSTVTNLKLTNSAIAFAPPDSGSGFKTLTVTNYVGSGANITLYAALGGSNSASDKIVINGGSATGTTLLTIKNVGGSGAPTTGAGIPLVVATNGGTISPSAFSLTDAPVVGAFKYTLDQSNQSWYLVSSPTASVGQITNSITNVAKAQQTQIITNRVLTSILLGANEQISCSSCGSGFGSIGSFAAGAHGRWGLTDELTLMGGLSYNQWNGSGVVVTNAPTVAASLVYDFWKWGASRPFFEIGAGLTPYEDVSYSRYYPVGFATGRGNASAIDRELTVFGRAGWVARLSEVDEAAVYGDLGRNWMQTGGYTEMTSASNPYPATVANGLDTLNVARLGAQYTRLFNGNIEVNVSGAVAYGFGAGSGAAVNVYGFGPIAAGALPNTAWGEYGARIGYRLNNNLVIDAFVIGTAFGEVGTTIHGGVGLRLAF